MYKVSGVMLEENSAVALSHTEMMQPLLPQAKYLQHVLVCAFSNTRPLSLKKNEILYHFQRVLHWHMTPQCIRTMCLKVLRRSSLRLIAAFNQITSL